MNAITNNSTVTITDVTGFEYGDLGEMVAQAPSWATARGRSERPPANEFERGLIESLPFPSERTANLITLQHYIHSDTGRYDATATAVEMLHHDGTMTNIHWEATTRDETWRPVGVSRSLFGRFDEAPKGNERKPEAVTVESLDGVA